MKCPYTFPHKSRKAMVDYLIGIGGYSERFGRWPLEWNCKTYQANFDGDTLRRHIPTLSPQNDEKWEEYIGDNQAAWEWWLEDARRIFSDAEWTSYPGDDQGDWEFSFAGRQGGHLVLDSWRGNQLRGMREDDFETWLSELSFSDLRKFYRGVVCLSQDVTPRKAADEMEYKAAFHRENLEDEWAVECAAQFAPAQELLEIMAAQHAD
jgi:hypothetical protein